MSCGGGGCWGSGNRLDLWGDCPRGGWWSSGLADDHLEELVGELWDVLEPLGRPWCPSVIAVSLYLARGAIAQTVIELDVHVVFDALVRYRRA